MRSRARFEVADIHPSPPASSDFTVFYVVLLPQGRYVVRHASMLDLIATAYGMDRESVQGGPSWMEWDHFDIVAKVPPNTSKDTLKLMLRSLLEERFQLKIGSAVRPTPAYVLSADKAKLKLRGASGSGDSRCEDKAVRQPGSITPAEIACRNMTMDEFAAQIQDMARGYLPKPVVNSTGLEGPWDFELKWTNRGDLSRAGSDGISLFAAVEKQLGLKLELQTVPRPVTLVESVMEKPTANVAGMDTMMPPLPVPQFEVATIKPSKPGTRENGSVGADMVKFDGIPLKEMIDLAWDLNEGDNEVIANPPKWLNEDRFDIMAKVGSDSMGVGIAGDAGGLPMDLYEIQQMLQALLSERFKIKAHMEDQADHGVHAGGGEPEVDGGGARRKDEVHGRSGNRRQGPANRTSAVEPAGKLPEHDDGPDMRGVAECGGRLHSQHGARWHGDQGGV